MADEPNSVVSIIMPVNNGQLFIAQSIESVLTQTYKKIELIIVDDGSSDLTAKIIDKYASKDNRIKFISLEKNHGVSVARNKGLELAIGRHVSFIDSDDIMSPLMIERMVEIAENTGANIVLANYTSSLKHIGICKSKLPWLLTPIEAVERMFYQKNEFDSASFAKLFARNLFHDNQFQPGIRYEDLFLLPKIYIKANKIAKIDDNLYYYRRNKEGFMFSNSIEHIDLLYVTDTLKQELTSSVPCLEGALIHRRFSALMNILRRSCQQNMYLDKTSELLIISEIKRLSPLILNDKKARIKNKIGALLVFSGIPTLKLAMKWL